MANDIRWQQRFSNYKKALATLSAGIKTAESRVLSDLEKQGIIQGFEFTHELCWKVMQDFLKDQGEANIYGSKDATRLAFNRGLITNGEDWMSMIKDRNLTSHTYEAEISEQIYSRVVNVYFALFKAFETQMDALCNSD